MYSNGFALASNLELPRFQEIGVAGDHGVGFSLTAADKERRMPGENFLTWSDWRLHLDLKSTKKIHLIKHPYIDLISREKIHLDHNRRGTLVFVPHSVPGLKSQPFDTREFIESVTSIEGLDSPFVFSLHMHDIGGVIHQALLDHGQEVVSAGDTSHPKYVYRFFEMVRRFKFACGSTIGSQTFFLHHLGADYFLIPDSSHMSRAVTLERIIAPELRHAEELFDFKNLSRSTEAKDDLVARGLGISSRSISNTQIKSLIAGKSL